MENQHLKNTLLDIQQQTIVAVDDAAIFIQKEIGKIS